MACIGSVCLSAYLSVSALGCVSEFECVCVRVCEYQTLSLCYCTMVGDHSALSSMLLLAGPDSLCHEENSCFMNMSGCEPCPSTTRLPHLLLLLVCLRTDIVYLTLTFSIYFNHALLNKSPQLSNFLLLA